MLGAVFSFRGRLGRLAFVGWMLAATSLVFVIGLGFLLMGGVLSGFFPVDGMGPRILGMLMAFTAAVVGIWSMLALQTKRLRDMGFRPVVWMTGISALMIADQWLLTHTTELRFFPPLSQYTLVGGVTVVAYLIALLTWPGAVEPEEEAALAPAPRKALTPLSPASSPLLLVTPTQATHNAR